MSAPTTSVSLACIEGPGRLRRLRERLESSRLDALLVSAPADVHYLTGLARDSFAALLISAQSATLIYPEYQAQPRASLSAAVDVELVPERVMRTAADRLRQSLPAGARAGGQAEHLTHAAWSALETGLRDHELQVAPGDELLEGLRAVKSAGELELMRAAAGRLSAMFEWLSGQPVVGRSEADVAWSVERFLRELDGVSELAFATVVAGGAHAASPHHTASNELIVPGQLLIVDAGCVLAGYRADMTRMFATGPLDAEAAAAYELVAAAQTAALNKLKAGVSAAAVHDAAAAVIAAAGHGDHFIHGVGHGVGLELHEPPYAESDETARLKAGQVLTVEPGIYIPGRLGVRIEDEVAVTATGFELLTHASRQLITVGS